jgi:hypothetical protein
MPISCPQPGATDGGSLHRSSPRIERDASGVIAALVNLAALAAMALLLGMSPAAAQCYSNGSSFVGTCSAQGTPGSNGIAVGDNTRADQLSTAFGDHAIALNDSATAVGHDAVANDFGVSMGTNAAKSTVNQGITSIGTNSNSTPAGAGRWSTAMARVALAAVPVRSETTASRSGAATAAFSERAQRRADLGRLRSASAVPRGALHQQPSGTPRTPATPTRLRWAAR